MTTEAKVVLISGCSSGVGLSLAVLLAKSTSHSYRVYATMRNLSKKDKLVQEAGESFDKSLFLLELDVTSDQSVDNVVKTVLDKEGRIDVLVNNAGQGLFGPLETISLDDVKATFDTNFYGVVRLTKAVLPSMKSKRSGKIINVTSVGGLYGFPFNEIYTGAKFAVEGFSESLQPLLRNFDIKIHNVEPGAILTDFMTNANKSLTGADEATQKLFQEMAKRMMTGFNPASGQTGEQVARVIVERVIEDANAPFRVLTNQHEAYTKVVNAKYSDPTGEKALQLIFERFFG